MRNNKDGFGWRAFHLSPESRVVLEVQVNSAIYCDRMNPNQCQLRLLDVRLLETLLSLFVIKASRSELTSNSSSGLYFPLLSENSFQRL